MSFAKWRIRKAYSSKRERADALRKENDEDLQQFQFFSPVDSLKTSVDLEF
jgi:hypothetical protein